MNKDIEIVDELELEDLIAELLPKEHKRVLKKSHKFTEEEAESWVNSHDLRTCAICGKQPKGFLVIDHDHKTEEVRGMLCKQCNIGLGAFKDNPMFLFNAVKYLLKNNDIRLEL